MPSSWVEECSRMIGKGGRASATMYNDWRIPCLVLVGKAGLLGTRITKPESASALIPVVVSVLRMPGTVRASRVRASRVSRTRASRVKASSRVSRDLPLG